jgi:single-stranded DNA-binding protein
MPLAIEIVEMAEHHHAQAIWEPADIIERGRNDVDNECYAKAGIAILATSAGSLGTPETMLSVLASGTLVSKPRQRIGNSGKPFATAQARIPSDGEASVLLSIIAFRDTAMQALLALDQGDAVALVGRGKLTCWQTNGGERHGLSVVAEQVLSVYQLEKRRSASTRAKVDADVPAQASKPDRAATAPDSGLVGDMTDDLPWPT